KSKRKRPVARQETAKKPVNEKREQQNQREIAKVTLAKDYVFDRAKISEARAAVVENALPAFKKAGKIAVQQSLQDNAADTVGVQAVIATIERPDAAEKACIINRNHERRKDHSDKRQDRPLPPDAHQYHDKTR